MSTDPGGIFKPRWARELIATVGDIWDVSKNSFELLEGILQRLGVLVTAISDMNDAIDRLGAEVKLDTAVLDELAGMVRAAGAGGSIPADQVAALVTRIDSTTGQLTTSRTADTPAATTPAAQGGSPTVTDPTGTGTPPATPTG